MKFLIKLTFFCFIFIFFSLSTFSSTALVENIFLDIDSNYSYRDELQTFYDKEVIYPDENGNFNPYSNITRDDFIGITMEIVCEKCKFPHTDYKYINSYSSKTDFFDVLNLNKNFYCIYSAIDNEYISGYEQGYECDDNTTDSTKKSFCINNTVTKQDAIMTLLKSSKLFGTRESDLVIQDINNGVITDNLSDDVSPKNIDGTVNIYYPYLEKALNIELIEYDSSGTQKTYKMLEINDSKIRPEESITRQDFLRLAYIISKLNACNYTINNDIALKIDIYDGSCQKNEDNCNLSDLSSSNTLYDFDSTSYSSCASGVTTSAGYTWWFNNLSNGKNFVKYGKYLDDINFSSSGLWKNNLRVVDDCGKKSEVYSFLVVGDTSSTLTTNIKTNYIYSDRGVDITFEAIVSSGFSPYIYKWDFGDGKTGIGNTIKHIYLSDGLYNVKLKVIDNNGLFGESSIFFRVLNSGDCTTDSDNDTVDNCQDKCPLIYGDSKNSGCPILYSNCNNDCSCPDNYSCDSSNIDTCSSSGYCIPSVDIDTTSCLYKTNSNSIFGKVICTTSPCENYLDFLADLRRCDEVYPIIVSLDGNTVYSTGVIWTSTGGTWKIK